jgi:putative acyl-CoA dehydrogenase
VTNQPPPFEDVNLFDGDIALRDAVMRNAAGTNEIELTSFGALAGSAQTYALGFAANRNDPELHTHDRFGRRIDEVTFHPAWHQLMEISTSHGLHAAPWRDASPHAHTHRAAKFFLMAQVEAGHGCPISMTYAAVPALRAQPDLAAVWEPRLTERGYDPVLAPIANKTSALCGMAMTEKQGGSDVRANTTQAVPAGSSGEYRVTGHKWFCSAPMSDAFLVLAQTDAGLTCFLMPRVLPDGSRNAFYIARLKDKLGNRSNASSEVEFDAASAWIVGERGRGVPTIAEMVNSTRLDCIIGSAGTMRQALAQAIHHARYRKTFGKRLVEHPAMQNVLADLALESEAATWLFARLARATDEAQADAQAASLRRIGTAVGKYWVCKRTPAVVGEALECLGGNGYVEESILPRLYREAPLNSIWEGSGNINALDVLRILAKHPECTQALLTELRPGLSDSRLGGAVRDVEPMMRNASESAARTLVQRIALLWQATLLLQDAPAIVSDAFIASRIVGPGGRAFGTLDTKTAFAEVIARALPA